MEPWVKPPVVGKRMGEAWQAVQTSPGIPEVTLARQFGWPVVDRIVKANLVTVVVTNLGRTLQPSTPIMVTNSEPDPDYRLKSHKDGIDRTAIIRNNVLSVACPVCHSAVGRRCTSTKNNAEVPFPHNERYKECVYVLSIVTAIA